MRRTRSIGRCAAITVMVLGGAATTTTAATLPVTGTLDLAGTSGRSTLEGTVKGGLAGAGLAAIGDFDGDGTPDVAIGEPRRKTAAGGDRAGAVHVLSGTAASKDRKVDEAPSILIEGAAESQAGSEVQAAGDVNGDGFADLLIGAPTAGTTIVEGERVLGGGAAYLVFGRKDATTIDLATDASTLRITGAPAGSRLGSALDVIGDLNGDGIAELVVSAPSQEIADRARAGVTYVLHGTRTAGDVSVEGLVERGAGWRLDGPPASVAGGALSGRSVAAIDDLNGDKKPELLLTAPRAATGGPDAKVADGRAYVVFGRSDAAVTDLSALGDGGFTIARTATRTAKDGGDWLGESIAAIGDVNADGVPDIGVGAHLADAPDRVRAGTAYVVYGRSGTANVDLDRLTPAVGYKIDGVAAGDFTGAAVTGVGDMNADGIADFAVTAPFADPDQRASAGAAFVVFGRKEATGPLDLSEFGDRALRVSGAKAGDVTGFVAAGGGDLDGDKGPELLLGGPRISDDYLFSGRADQPGVVQVVQGQTPVPPEVVVGPAAVIADPGYAEALEAGCRIATNVQALIEDNGYTDRQADPKRIRRYGLEGYIDDPRNADTVLGISGFPSIFGPTVLGPNTTPRLGKLLQEGVDGEDGFPGYVKLVESLGVENPAAQARIILVDGYLFRDMEEYSGLTEGNPPTYVIVVGRPPDRDASDIKELKRLAVDTKGGLYRAESPREIERSFQRIESRLRCDVTAETGYDEVYPGEPAVLLEDEVDEDAETADVELTWRDPDDGFEIESVDVIDSEGEDEGDLVRRISGRKLAAAYGLNRTQSRKALQVGGRGKTFRQLHIRKLRQGTKIRVKVRTRAGDKGGRVYARMTQNRLRR